MRTSDPAGDVPEEPTTEEIVDLAHRLELSGRATPRREQLTEAVRRDEERYGPRRR